MNIKELDLLDFVSANKKLIRYLQTGKKISNKDLVLLLNLKEKEIVSSFLEGYYFFTKKQLSIIEKFVNRNLTIDDKDFLSDIIDFSSNFGLNLNYKKIIGFLSKDKEEFHFVVLSTINYLTENIKLAYISELIEEMKKILQNSNYYQNSQISAALFLYRITFKKKYLKEINFLIKNNKNNIVFLQNKLENTYYQSNFFNNDFLKTIKWD